MNALYDIRQFKQGQRIKELEEENEILKEEIRILRCEKDATIVMFDALVERDPDKTLGEFWYGNGDNQEEGRTETETENRD